MVNTWAQCLGDCGVGDLKGILGNDQTAGVRRRDTALQEHGANPGEEVGITREPADGVIARRLQQKAVERNPAMRWAQSIEATKTRGDTYGATGIRPQGKIDQAPGNGRGGATR